MTRDPDAATAFYTAMFGWDVVEWVPTGAPGGTPPYPMIAIQGKPFGGIMRLGGEAPPPSHWMGHVRVEDIDAAVAKAESMGATFPAGIIDIPTVGRDAPMIDPLGCAIGLFSPASDQPMEVPGAMTPGMAGWNELMVDDPEAAMAFYGAVLGWTFRKSPASHLDYWLFGGAEPGTEVGGLARKPDCAPRNSWTLYFCVQSVDEAGARMRSLGGRWLQEPFDVPGVARMAVCESPDGAEFALAEWRFPGAG